MKALFVVVVAAVLVQLVFMVWLARGLRRSLSHKSRKPEYFPPVSVLVVARNEEPNLRELLPLLLGQNYPVYEIVVVDDRSEDGTYDYLLELSLHEKRLKPVRIDRTPSHINAKKYAITLGVKAAAHDWLLLTDADCRPATNGWIEGMSRHMTDDVQFVLGCSPYETSTGMLNRFICFETLYTALQYVALAGNGLPYMGVGRNMAYRKSFFLQHKGFNGFQHLNGGDDDLLVNRHARSNNTRVCAGASCLMISKPKTTWMQFFQQKKRHLSAGKFYRARHKMILGALTGTHVLAWTGGLTLLAAGFQAGWVAALLLVRTGSFAVLMDRTARKIGFETEKLFIPVLDFLYPFYYLTTAPAAWAAKRITWKS
ncbi:MAG: glycosyl transferase family 2 [Cyclobacteriaceae bacterium]|nr:MAG: glycosyl transferase family 2 [Cyclobacteriaceae bacterium]